jgi:hypothetical protein
MDLKEPFQFSLDSLYGAATYLKMHSLFTTVIPLNGAGGNSHPIKKLLENVDILTIGS